MANIFEHASCFSVCKLSRYSKKYEKLYDFIENFEDAFLLSQLAMSEKKDDELIFIFPGWNLGIEQEKYKDAYERALQLAYKYKAEVI